MTQEQLKAIRARADAATPGPWTTERDNGYIIESMGMPEYFRVAHVEDDAAQPIERTARDAAFISGARTDVPLLCEEMERLMAENGRLRRAIEILRPLAEPYAEAGGRHGPEMRELNEAKELAR